MKLYVDDLRSPPDGWVLAKTYSEAAKILQNENVTHLSLDHDLGEEKTGYDIACLIERMAYTGEISEINLSCHSANTVVRERIEYAFYSARRFWNNE